MIRSIRVMRVGVTNKREYLAINYSDTSPFLVTDVEGINPPSSSINFTESVFKDGSYFNSSSINNRNLVLSMDFVTTTNFPTISGVRKKAFELFPPGQELTLEFVTDDIEKPVYIKGYIETNESSMFTDRPGSVVSLLCPQPYFYEADLTTLQASTDIFNFGPSAGTAPSPVIFKKTFNNTTGSFTIGRDGETRIGFDQIPAGSTLEISFDPENRYVKLTKDGPLKAYNYITRGALGITVSNAQGEVGVFGNTGNSTPGFEIKFRRMYLGL